MSDMLADITAAIERTRAALAALPIVVAEPSVIEALEEQFPWYPQDRLVPSAMALPGRALVIDPSLDWRA